MKKITISLDEKVAAWARQHVARRNISLSRFVGELLGKTMRESRERERVMLDYLSSERAPLKRGRARYPSRDKLYDRGRLR